MNQLWIYMYVPTFYKGLWNQKAPVVVASQGGLGQEWTKPAQTDFLG